MSQNTCWIEHISYVIIWIIMFTMFKYSFFGHYPTESKKCLIQLMSLPVCICLSVHAAIRVNIQGYQIGINLPSHVPYLENEAV